MDVIYFGAVNNFASEGTLSNVWIKFWWSQPAVGGALLLKLIGLKPGMLLNTLQCTGHTSVAKNYSAQSVNCPALENPCPRVSLALLLANNSQVSKCSGCSMKIFYSCFLGLRCLSNLCELWEWFGL